MEKKELPYQQKVWLSKAIKEHTAQQIADMFSVTPSNIFYYLNKFKIQSPRDRGYGNQKYTSEEQKKKARSRNAQKYASVKFANCKNKLFKLPPNIADDFDSIKDTLKLNAEESFEVIIKNYLKYNPIPKQLKEVKSV
jgi:hypothetical protein